MFTNNDRGSYKEENLVIELIDLKQRENIKKLVEVQNPTDEIPESTDNIAEQNSVASGPVVKESGDVPGPVVNDFSEFDTLGNVENPPKSGDFSTNLLDEKRQIEKKGTASETNKEKVVVSKKVEKSQGKTITTERAKEEIYGEEVQKDLANSGSLKKEQDLSVKDRVSDSEGEENIAMVTPKNTAVTRTQGRVYNRVKREGVLGFEALQDEIAPYLKSVQKKVERYWLHLLLTKYSGTKPTEVVIDCEIGENGNLVKLEVVGSAEDPFYAGICKLALERASPFPPLPFKIPDIYQRKTLQIRWTFSFM
ncbi:MAG: energy transducer TonB [Candidatus Hydrogenedentes bacterium]|nr:energy transducer TonB [Candidatus Hydrogenedentota bacterium]